MSFEVRPLELADIHAHRTLMSHAFSHGRVVSADPPEIPEESVKGTWAVYEGGTTLKAALSIVPFEAHWGDGPVLPLGGIAGVATFAEARGRGYVDALLRQCLAAMRDAGQVLSALYPFSWAFYRRYGWEWVGEKRHVTLPLREVRASPEGKNVTAVSGEKVRETLEPIYTDFARRYRSVFTTETHRWESSLGHHDNRMTHVYVHADGSGGSPDGYLLWRYERDGEKGSVRELIASTPGALRGLLSLLHYMGTQCERASVTVPADSPLWSHVMHWDVETKVAPVFMGRVVDLARALEGLNVGGVADGAVTLAVRDESAPWNDGTWRIAAEGGKLACAPAVGGRPDADVTADIQAISQAFFGTPSLAWLRAAGRIGVAGETGYSFLSRLLPAAPVFTLDDF